MNFIQALEQLVSGGKLAEALDFIEALPQEEHQRWQIQNLTGIVCANCGQPESARTFFDAALKQQPDNPEVLYNLAETCACLRLNRRAKELLNRCEQCTDSEEVKRDAASLRQGLSEQKGGRVLFVAYYFPPLAGSGVFRSLKFAKYMPQSGWQPTVLSTDQPPNGWKFADQSLVSEIPEEMEVVRIPDGIQTGRETTLDSDRAQAILGFLRGVLRFSPEADHIYLQTTTTKEGIMSLFTFPCGALAWAYDTVQYIEKNLDLDKFDVVYTTSGPSSAHLIGFYLKQKYSIPWVADYRDQWTFNPYGAPYDPSNAGQKLLFELESVLLRQADCNISVGEEWAKNYVDRFHIPKDQVACITNGYDEADFASLKIPAEKTEQFTINYSGLIYSANRSIAPVFKAIQQLCAEKKINPAQIKLRIVGNLDPNAAEIAKKYKLESILLQTGYLPHGAALQSNLDSDLLLLLVGDQSNMRGFHTAKLFDYLRCGRPILALAPEDGVVGEILRESNHGISCLSTQTLTIKAMILREYQNWQHRDKAAPLLHSSLIEQFERQRLTRQLAQVFEKVCEGQAVKLQEIPSSAYDMGYKNGGPGGTYHKHYTRSHYYNSWKLALNRLYFLERNISILEIGCGPGQFANMLFDNGFTNYTGFDYSAEGIALAKRNNPEHANCFSIADAFQTPLLDQKYDLVICFEVLEHIQSDIELLQRIRPGTKLLVSVPNFDDPYHVRYFNSEEEVRKLRPHHPHPKAGGGSVDPGARKAPG